MWDEDKHPRDNSGKFTDKQGGSRYSKEQINRARNIINERAANYRESQHPDKPLLELDILLGKEYTGVKGQAAIDKLMQEKQGHVKGAFHRDDIGDIDLLWGSSSVGLQHIIQQRERQGIDVHDFVKQITDTIEKGQYYGKNSRGDFQFIHNGKMVVIAPEYHGQEITYLLTAFNTRYKAKTSPTNDDV